MINGCLAAGVKALVYTSSEDVVFTGRPIRDGDERLPYPQKFVNGYCRTKADAEVAVLAANGRTGAGGQPLRTAAVRPLVIKPSPMWASPLIHVTNRSVCQFDQRVHARRSPFLRYA